MGDHSKSTLDFTLLAQVIQVSSYEPFNFFSTGIDIPLPAASLLFSVLPSLEHLILLHFQAVFVSGCQPLVWNSNFFSERQKHEKNHLVTLKPFTTV